MKKTVSQLISLVIAIVVVTAFFPGSTKISAESISDAESLAAAVAAATGPVTLSISGSIDMSGVKLSNKNDAVITISGGSLSEVVISKGTFIFDGVTITGNTGSDGTEKSPKGGDGTAALSITRANTVTLINCIVSGGDGGVGFTYTEKFGDNGDGGNGGAGIVANNKVTLTLTGCTVTGGDGGNGGDGKTTGEEPSSSSGHELCVKGDGGNAAPAMDIGANCTVLITDTDYAPGEVGKAGDAQCRICNARPHDGKPASGYDSKEDLYYTAVEASPEEGGTVSNAPGFLASKGTVITITAYPKTDYKFVSWTGADNNKLSSTASFDYTVNGANTLTATFSEDLHEHEHVYVYSDNEDGTHTGTCECGATTDPEEHIFGEWECDQCTDETHCTPSDDPENPGTHSRVCTVCGAPDDPQNHEWSDWYAKESNDASSSDNPAERKFGTMHFRDCEICDDQQTEDHTWIYVSKDSEKHYIYCGKLSDTGEVTHYCDAEAIEDHTIPKDENGNPIYTAIDAKDHEYVCEDCGYHNINKHNYVLYDYKEATCTTVSITSMRCTECGNVIKTQGDALGHDWGDWVLVKEPTYTENGYYQRECKKCHETQTQTIGKLGEDHVHYFFDDMEITKKPTCTETGLAIVHCYKEGCTATEERVLSALGHDMGEWYTVTEPTETEPGMMRRDCSRCDYYETKEVPMLSHVHEYKPVEVVPPTCTEQGYTVYECECGDSYKDDFTDAIGHKYDDGVTEDGNIIYTCENCGETMSVEIPKDEPEEPIIPPQTSDSNINLFYILAAIALAIPVGVLAIVKRKKHN